MGTHPIFESDFDCLTECCLILSRAELPHRRSFSTFRLTKQPRSASLSSCTMKLPQNVQRISERCARERKDSGTKGRDFTVLLLVLWLKVEILQTIMVLEGSQFTAAHLPTKTSKSVTLSPAFSQWPMLGLILMVPSFFITFIPCPWLDGKHTV